MNVIECGLMALFGVATRYGPQDMTYVMEDHPNSGDVIIWDTDADSTYWVGMHNRDTAARLFEGPDALEPRTHGCSTTRRSWWTHLETRQTWPFRELTK
jgi:hypothetical protein